MRTGILKALTILGLGLAFAQGNPQQIIDSADTMEGALDSAFDSVVTQYVPGYGLQINARWLGSYDPNVYLETVSNVLTGLSPLVQGLSVNEYISISYTLESYPDSVYYTVRLVPGSPESYEVFVNGTKQ